MGLRSWSRSRSRSRSRWGIVGLTLVGVGLLLGVGQPAAQQPLRLWLSVADIANPFFVTLADGAKAAAQRFGAELTVVDAANDPAKQTADMDAAIAQRFDALLLNPTDVDALVPAVQRANQAGIPVITVDRDVSGGDRLAFIGTSNVLAAQMGAVELLAALMRAEKPQPWRIVLLDGIPGASSAIERERGFKNVLQPFVDQGAVEIVADLAANFARDQGEKVMSDVLARTQDVDAVLAANDLMALGALRAIELAGLSAGLGRDDIVIVGFDAIDEAVQMVKEGKFAATVAQAPYVMGYWAAEAAVRYVRGEWTPPRFFLATPVLVVTRANADRVAELTQVPPPLPGT